MQIIAIVTPSKIPDACGGTPVSRLTLPFRGGILRLPRLCDPVALSNSSPPAGDGPGTMCQPHPTGMPGRERVTLRDMDSDHHGSAAALLPHAPLQLYYGNERQKRSFIRNIFDSTAGDYDRVERTMALGTGSWYRRQALGRAGLCAGMKVLDVAVGTGLVAREASALAGGPGFVVGLD